MRSIGLDNLNGFTAQQARAAVRTDPSQRFADELARVERRQADARTDQRETLKEVARQLVSQAFYMPMLAQVRETSMKSELFHGGFGEQAFGAQWDQAIADRLAERDSTGLADAIVAKLTSSPGRAGAIR